MLSYYVEYKVTNSDEAQLKVVQNRNKTSLTGLQSHAVYEVRVRAVNGAGGGIWSHYETFSTGQTCKRKDELTFCKSNLKTFLFKRTFC